MSVRWLGDINGIPLRRARPSKWGGWGARDGRHGDGTGCRLAFISRKSGSGIESRPFSRLVLQLLPLQRSLKAESGGWQRRRVREVGRRRHLHRPDRPWGNTKDSQGACAGGALGFRPAGQEAQSKGSEYCRWHIDSSMRRPLRGCICAKFPRGKKGELVCKGAGHDTLTPPSHRARGVSLAGQGRTWLPAAAGPCGRGPVAGAFFPLSRPLDPSPTSRWGRPHRGSCLYKGFWRFAFGEGCPCGSILTHFGEEAEKPGPGTQGRMNDFQGGGGGGI